MSIFKRKKKNNRERVLKSVHKGVNEGVINDEIKYINSVYEQSIDTDFLDRLKKDGKRLATDEEHKAFFNTMTKMQNAFDVDRKKQLKEMKKANKPWNKFKKNIKDRCKFFVEKLNEVYVFIKFEFRTIRKLIFFINDQFFGQEFKNRNLFYNHKETLIKSNGYAKGEKKYNGMIKRLTDGVKLNKRLLNGRYG